MKLADAGWCLVCVGLVSVGQVMLRAASLTAKAAEQPGLRAWINGTTFLAMLTYGVAMLLWLWVLGRVPLTQAFAYFGLSFFIVPLLAHRWLGDAVSTQTWVGAAIIAMGIVISSWRQI